MKTGIIRRIDDLGRIVIPKEVRRALHIGEGDPLEISTSGRNIVLTPYELLSEMDYILTPCVEALSAHKDMVIITTKDRVLRSTVCDVHRDTPLTPWLMDVIQTRKEFLSADNTNQYGEKVLYTVKAVLPIVSCGDLFGAVIVLSNTSDSIEDAQLQRARFVAEILRKAADTIA